MKRKTSSAVAVALVVVAGSCTARLLRDPQPYFVDRRSSFLSAAPGTSTIEKGFEMTPVRVSAASGLAVDLVVRRAVADLGRALPVALILGGPYTGRDAARMVGDTRGILVAAMSYPFTGNPRPDAPTFLRQIPSIRTAFLDTPPAIQIAIDYLLRRPDADSAHIEAVGVSLGAPFVCIAGALDRRITRVWAVHGTGGSYRPLEANMHRTISFAPARVIAAAIATILIDGPRLDPTKWVARIAPRPFVMINASDDERLPRASVEALYRAAGEPKEQIWMSGAHIHGDSATISRIVEIVAPRIRDDVSVKAAARAP